MHISLITCVRIRDRRSVNRFARGPFCAVRRRGLFSCRHCHGCYDGKNAFSSYSRLLWDIQVFRRRSSGQFQQERAWYEISSLNLRLTQLLCHKHLSPVGFRLSHPRQIEIIWHWMMNRIFRFWIRCTTWLLLRTLLPLLQKSVRFHLILLALFLLPWGDNNQSILIRS